jgi:hypothetical protein
MRKISVTGKLQLNREALRMLTPGEMNAVLGGVDNGDGGPGGGRTSGEGYSACYPEHCSIKDCVTTPWCTVKTYNC